MDPIQAYNSMMRAPRITDEQRLAVSEDYERAKRNVIERSVEAALELLRRRAA